jgi:potassium-dependent mechanosensitive channel
MDFRPRNLLAVLFLAMTMAWPMAAVAQGVGSTGSPLINSQRQAIDAIAKQTDEFEKRVVANAENDARLVEIRLKLEELSRSLLSTAVAFRPRLAEISSRLEQLGPAPAEGQPAEPDIIASERQELVAEKAEINAVLGVAESLSIRVSNLIDRIGVMRSDLFRNMLTKRYELTEAFGSEMLADIRTEVTSLYSAVASWLRFVFQFKLQSFLGATFFALAAAAVLLVGGRRVFNRVFDADPLAEAPSYLSRLSLAFWSTLLPTAAVAAFLASTLFFFNYFNILRGDIGVFLNALFLVIGVVFCVNRLARAVLSPSLPNWRLMSIGSGTARRLVLLVTAMAIVIGFNNFLTVVNDQMGSPLSLTIIRSFFAAIIVGVLLILIGLLKAEEGAWRPWRVWLRYTSIALGAIIILVALLGYIGLAIFISLQIVVTGTILITAYIGILSSRAVGAEGGFAETSLGRWMAHKGNTDDATLDQFGLVVSLLINAMIILIFLPLILLMWGFQTGDIEAWAYRLGSGFTIGTFRFSPTGILTGIAVFVVGYFLTRWFQGWLDGSVMARGRVDAGVQNVVSNFVSGLILLVERPFKAGDWIVAGEFSGTVKKISVRATEIETFQRQTVILPNSDLINSAVGNWTHRNKLGRVEVPVGVAYGSDARRVHEILMTLAQEHPLVLKNPEPFVLFGGFGDSSLDFELRVFLADVTNLGIVQNDLRFGILDAFAKENIEIPFPQRDLNIRTPAPKAPWPTDDDQAEAALVERKRRTAAAAPARRSRSRSRKPDPE